MPAAKVKHVIPCKHSLFINHLILNLSWSLIITTLGKSILLPLKVTVISSNLFPVYPIGNFYLALYCHLLACLKS